MTYRHHLVIVVLLSAAAVALVIWSGAPLRWAFSPTGTSLREGVGAKDIAVSGPPGGAPVVASPDEEPPGPDVEVVAEGLRIPWEIAFLPDGDMLVTERPGTLRRIGKDGHVIEVEGVEHVGEGGLLGLALHPDFERNQLVYLYLTTREGGALVNRVERYVYEAGRLHGKEPVIGPIPGAQYHDGGRIAFGPDGMLYITTGDAGEADRAQQLGTNAGKILRLMPDGEVPEDNPFGTSVWSYGHRNPQGIDWDAEGDLWSTEHGRSGARSGMDEINLILKGRNYGWPVIEGDAGRDGMRTPEANSGPNETWAPGDAVWFMDRLFFTGLRGESLYEVRVNAENSVEEITAHFRRDFGRLRAAVVGPDGYLYVTTSNTDGRGASRDGDDRIIRIHPRVFR